MFCEFEDADETNDAKKRQRRTGLGAGATHRRQDIEQRHIIWHNGHHIHDVLEVFPEVDLGRACNEAHDRLEREPCGTSGLDDEEGIEEVWSFVLDAVRQRERRQRLDAEQND